MVLNWLFENLPLCITKYYYPITYLRTKIFNIDNWVTSPKKVQKNLGDGYLFLKKYKKNLASTVGSWLGTVAEIHNNLYY